MPSRRTFHRTVVTIEILSEDPIGDVVDSLEMIDHQITDGDWSGKVDVTSAEELDGPTAARLLAAQGSDPEFFGLTDDGDDVDE